jgi:AraC-like DNA-binding protein
LREIGSEDLSDGETGRLLGNHLADLAAFALNTESLERSRGVRAARCAAILREIERRIADPQLTPTTIALSLGITPRYIHRVLEDTNRTFSDHVLQRRLERAAILLRDPQWLQHKVSGIANESGFKDLSYFNRSFRRYFGVTPSDMRRDRLSGAE